SLVHAGRPVTRRRVPVVRAERLAPGEVHTAALDADERGRPREALVIRDEDGAPRAYLNRCRHLPIPLDAGSRVFLDVLGTHLVCGTHGARYRLRDGLCVEGPCVGLALEALTVTTEDGWIVVEE